MPDKHAERIASLETQVFNQGSAITELRKQTHESELQSVKMTSTLEKIDESQVKLGKQLKTMDTELKTSFKERDEVVTNLRIGYAKLFAFAVAAFTGISFAIQVVMK